MRRLSTLQLIPGMVVAESVLNVNRQLVMSKGTVLTDKLITRLELYGILSIFVEDEIPRKNNTPAPSTPTYSERIKESKDFKQFKQEYEQNIDSFRDVVNQVVEKNVKLDVKALLSSSLETITSSKGQIGVLDMLHNMREYDDDTFAHCMNVGLICNVFARWLKMDEKQIEQVTACGLMHDIGKLLIPHSIIAKPGKLSAEEYATVQKHPIAGYQLLKNSHADEHICNAALMHHERCDGTGYPLHLTGDKIDKYARIVAIADVYDAITAARCYRGPQCPFRVIEMFELEGFQRYDVEYLLIFLENVVNTYLRNRCRLSDGREGDIIYINKDKLSKPVVKCGTDYVNLMEYTNLTITDLL